MVFCETFLPVDSKMLNRHKTTVSVYSFSKVEGNHLYCFLKHGEVLGGVGEIFQGVSGIYIWRFQHLNLVFVNIFHFLLTLHLLKV